MNRRNVTRIICRRSCARYDNIHNENSLQTRRERIVPKNELDFIIGNPPFVVKSFRDNRQKFDMDTVFENIRGHGNLDYVACRFKKTSDFIKNIKIRVAFLATNSICQGIAVPSLRDWLFTEKFHIEFVKIKKPEFFSIRAFLLMKKFPEIAEFVN